MCIKDTTQFTNELENITCQKNDWLVTIDVKSLYTNLLYNESIQACLEALYKLEETNPQQPPSKILANLLEVVLKNNTFVFNDIFYKQLYGKAMGTKFAPAYENIFMG